MNIRSLALGALSAVTLVLAGPATAAVSELKFAAPISGPVRGAEIYFVGLNPDNHSLLYDGLGAKLTLTLGSVTNNGYSWNFAYSLKNVSTIASRVGTIGWDISPDPLNTSNVGGDYAKASGGNMSFHGPVEFCLKNSNGSNCGGGAGGGPSTGEVARGNFTLNYKESVTTTVTSQVPIYGAGKGKDKGKTVIVGYNTVSTQIVTPVPSPRELVFNNFGMHWQSLPGGRSTVGVPGGERALVVNAVPEPGTWALMILGFGGVGAMLRQRRRAALA